MCVYFVEDSNGFLNFFSLVSEVGVENPEKKRVESVQMKVLVQKLKEIEIDMASYKPGQYSRLLCPKVYYYIWCFYVILLAAMDFICFNLYV